MRIGIVIMFIVVLLTGASDSFSQLQVTAHNNAAQLAQTLAGAGVVISNAAMNCPVKVVAYFLVAVQFYEQVLFPAQ